MAILRTSKKLNRFLDKFGTKVVFGTIGTLISAIILLFIRILTVDTTNTLNDGHENKVWPN